MKLVLAGVLIVALCASVYVVMIRMPGKSYRGPLPALSESEASLRDALEQDVRRLAEEIGERNVDTYEDLAATADFLEASLSTAGYTVRRHGYQVGEKSCDNLEVELTGTSRPEEIVVVGAHYDTVPGCAGANDNATGVAAMLALARGMAGSKTARTLRFLAFVNEEPPYFQSGAMGSQIYAGRCRQRDENVVAMLSIETVGYYSAAVGSQQYPFPFGLLYPSQGDFVAFVGNVGSRRLVRNVVRTFRRHAKFPSEGAALPGVITGVGWSDHWSFWQEGYPALMVTDTALFRYPYYHTPEDTVDKIDFDRMARVVAGLQHVVADLVGRPDSTAR